MANLLSTAPAAFDFFLNEIKDAAALADITVIDAELVQYEPGVYIELSSIGNHRFEIDSLGAYVFYEMYELQGVVRVWRGDNDMQQARVDAYYTYQNYVMTPVVNNRTFSNLLLWIVPASAESLMQIIEQGGRQCTIDFAFSCQARITP
jgi:hypothetical protein